jgi:hypothetical protein
MTRRPYADQCTRVYTRTGKTAHLMSPVQSIRNGSVLCSRVTPEWFTEWHGTGSQNEIDRAASLPLCKRCEDQARREDEYYSEPSQWSALAHLDPAAGPPSGRAARASVPGRPRVAATPVAAARGGDTPDCECPVPDDRHSPPGFVLQAEPATTRPGAGSRKGGTAPGRGSPDPAGGEGASPLLSAGQMAIARAMK